MKDSEEYFLITVDHLKGEKIFSFHLFIYNPLSDEFTTFLFANSPLDEGKMEILNFILERGGELGVKRKQKKTFLHSLELEENQVPGLKIPEKHPLEKEREEHLKQLESKDFKKHNFPFKGKLIDALKEDNFLEIIERARDEILCLDVTVSHMTSLAIFLAKKFLIVDNHINRIVAFSYFLARNCNTEDQEALGDLICSAFFAHIGQTQMERYLSYTATLEMSDDQAKKYEKHPGLAHHLIRKSEIDFSDRAKIIIFEHHERWNGRGYPNYKKGDRIEQLALVLGAASHLFEYASGKVTGKKESIPVILSNMRDRNFKPGLEFEFGSVIFESLINLLDPSMFEGDGKDDKHNDSKIA